MDLVKIGALKEARLLRDAMLNNPSATNWARYRAAVIKVSTLFREPIEDASLRINQPTEHIR